MVLDGNQLSDSLLYFLAFSTGIDSIAKYTTAIAVYSDTYGTTNKFLTIINNENELTTKNSAEWRSPYHPAVQVYNF